MMSSRTTSGKAGYIIEDVSGCGPFQVIVVVSVMLISQLQAPATMNFMVFGGLNPGWRCLDASSMNHSLSSGDRIKHVTLPEQPRGDSITGKMSMLSYQNTKNASTAMAFERRKDDNNSKMNRSDISNFDQLWYTSRDERRQCAVFDNCQKVIFNPESRTIVSEWSLVCGRGWIPSFITSLQMVGLFFGCLIAGHISDRFGRKRTLYSGIALLTVLNFLAVISSTWKIYLIFRISLGFGIGILTSINFIYVSEFLPNKWIMRAQALPMWYLNSIFFSVVCMILKDWRNIHIATGIFGVVGLIPAIWMPESLRWLEVKHKNEKFEKEVVKIVRINRKKLPAWDERTGVREQSYYPKQVVDTEAYSIRILFTPEYRKTTFLISFPWIIVSLISYGIIFGIKALHGNFYINFMIFSSITVCFSIIPIIVPNIIGRKRALILFAILAGVCFTAAGFIERFGSGDVKTYGVSACVFLGFVFIDDWWCVLVVITLEIHPTVIRSLSSSWGNSLARVGAMVAPFVIPNNPAHVHISYFLVAVLAVLVCGCFWKLPETNRRRLKDIHDSKIAKKYGAENNQMTTI